MDQRLCNQNTAFHASRQSSHVRVSLVAQIQIRNHFINPVVIVFQAEITGLQPQGFPDGKKRIENQLLRDDSKAFRAA